MKINYILYLYQEGIDRITRTTYVGCCEDSRELDTTINWIKEHIDDNFWSGLSRENGPIYIKMLTIKEEKIIEKI